MGVSHKKERTGKAHQSNETRNGTGKKKKGREGTKEEERKKKKVCRE
jgi:hypothetical protein